MVQRTLIALILVPSAFAAAPPVQTGALVIVGGGGTPAEVQKRFVELAGGEKAHLVVIPTASGYADDAKAPGYYLDHWRKQRPASVKLFHTRRRAEADDAAFVKPLRQATGVWISGGDQSRLTAAYRGTAVERELKRLLARGGVIGGTSAGAAVMTEVMITGGRREATLGEGLGLLPGAVVDQHFLARDRVDRLMGVLGKRPGLIGLGIDEATAAVVRGGRVEVLGQSYVLAIALRGKLPTIRVLRKGDRLELESLRIVHEPGTK